MNRIELAGREILLDEVRGNPGRYGRLFDEARIALGHAFCLCRDPDKLRIVIRRTGQTFSLARWPLEGPRHDIDCDFHATEVHLSGADGYTREAIEIKDGSLNIKGAFSLSHRVGDVEAPTPANIGADQGSRKKRNAAGLLGILHVLWDVPKLNYWHPRWSRDWSRVHYELTKVLSGKINGQSLRASVYVIPQFREAEKDANDKAFEDFLGTLVPRDNVVQRGLLVFEVKEIGDTKHGFSIALRHSRHRVFGSNVLRDQLRKSYRSAYPAIGRAGSHVIGLALIERNPNGYIIAKQMALMLTGNKFIPADSSYEVDMAAALIKAGRVFFKPLRYEGVGDFPDFVLTDERDDVFVEVYGMVGHDEYDPRMQAKREDYVKRGVRVVEWIPPAEIPDMSKRG